MPPDPRIAFRLDDQGHVQALDSHTLWICGDTVELSVLDRQTALALACWSLRRGGMAQALGIIVSVQYVREDPVLLALWCVLEVAAACDPVVMGPTMRTMAAITAARLVVAEWERLAAGEEPEPVPQRLAVRLLAHPDREVRTAALAHMGWRRSRLLAAPPRAETMGHERRDDAPSPR